MTTDNWIGIEAAPGAARGWAFAGAEVVATAVGLDVGTVLARLGQLGPVIVAGAECAAQRVPAAALPEALAVTDSGLALPPLVQQAPAGRIGAARLRIIGYLALNPGWDGVICLAEAERTHWAQVSAGEVVSFQSFLTGRLAMALGAGPGADPEAVSATLSRPERLAAHLGSADLQGDAEAMLGHLIGAEMAAARPYWLGQQVAVIGGALAGGYAMALEAQGAPVTRAAEEAMTVAGFRALRRLL